ncbi:hypothetical protein NL676_039476 [Syzygium grande]|nr:hypothetical protein NL676_039476 [Syzygium grande]
MFVIWMTEESKEMLAVTTPSELCHNPPPRNHSSDPPPSPTAGIAPWVVWIRANEDSTRGTLRALICSFSAPGIMAEEAGGRRPRRQRQDRGGRWRPGGRRRWFLKLSAA